MQARVVVFPVKGRAWCFASPRATAPAAARGGGDGGAALPPPPPTVKDLWRGIAGGGRTASENAEAVVDFVADKVLDATGSAGRILDSLTFTAFSHAARFWAFWGVSDGGILAAADEPGVDRVRERAGGVDEEPDPQVGSLRAEAALAGAAVGGTAQVGYQGRLPARDRASGKYKSSSCASTAAAYCCQYSSIYIFPHPSVSAMFLRTRGASVHRKFLYGSVCLLPVTSVFMVLPLPNIPFFWVLFRAYSHWRALQGSERLLLLVSDSSDQWKILLEKQKEMSSRKDGNPCENTQYAPWNLQPSKKLDGFLESRKLNEGLDCDTISRICQAYDLDKIDVLKYRDLE
uniref:Uncharacterized protein n=1 Tax=Oryza meridionalis TaxID=40149 RepID=A0A0E0CFR9_9ORYZ